ncbi:MAG: amidase [Candidimonas sp.]|nr:MAG: amidase [Candidimonas sp.]TAM22758.1 MAG: amidase [Candidimonas sp.]
MTQRLTLKQAVADLQEGRYSAESLAIQCISRIEAAENQVHAWAWFEKEHMLSEARRADAELQHGNLCGPLHGIPLGVKDIISTRGIPTGMGSPIYEHFVPEETAACVERFTQAGAYIEGKTVTTEFATQYPGPTTNPWNTTCTPGGSSSGSAAAVAACFSLAALGTQTRGSIIRPAAFCGVVGFKPSYGLISRFGVKPVSETLDHVGVITQNIADAGLLVSTLVGGDVRDTATLVNTMNSEDLASLPMLEPPPRLAVIASLPWAHAEPPQQALLEHCCEALRRCGAHTEPANLPPVFSTASEVARSVQLFELARNFKSLEKTSGSRMSSLFHGLYARGADISVAHHEEMLELRTTFRRKLAQFLSGFDAIITHPALGEAPDTLTVTGDSAFNSLWTLCGVPCVTFPAGTGPRGLPLGLQIVGAFLNDVRTLQVAQWCADRLPFTSEPSI